MGLVGKLVLGILGGIVVGFWAPTGLVQICLTFKDVFAQFLGFIIPFLIITFIGEGIGNLNHNVGRLLGVTTILSYISTLGAGFLSATVALVAIPWFDLSMVEVASKNSLPKAFVTLEFAPLMTVMSSLVFSFVLGLGVIGTKASQVRSLLSECKQIIEWVIQSWIVPILPFYIACIFVETAAEGQVTHVLHSFGVVLFLAFCLHWVWLFVLYTAAALATGSNPFSLIKNMMGAYLTAIGTMSSAATIPMTLKQTLKNGVNGDVAHFVIPLCATIHIAGSTITLTVASIAVMFLTQNTYPTWDVLVPFIFLLGVTMVAAPGVPGGGVMAALGLFSSVLGFNEVALGLMIALYVAQDSFGTACNVTGDGALAILVDRMVGDKTYA
jgi:Na+/H+-dicarboxylate symporter